MSLSPSTLKRPARILPLIAALLLCALPLYAQIQTDAPISSIIEDIYSFLSEGDAPIDFEELEADLLELAEHPINLNTVTESDLRQLHFLSPEQIDAILLYVYQQPMHATYELMLIPALQPYEVRDLLPFVKVEEATAPHPLYWHDIWQYGRQEVDIRADARNIENNRSDPFYNALHYRFNYQQRVQFGITAKHDVGEPWWHRADRLPNGKRQGNGIYGYDFYSGYVQLQNIGHLQKLVVGDYQAAFGQGLVLNAHMRYGGKSSMVLSAGMPHEGITRYASTAEYDFFRGVATTLDCGAGFTLSAFYSARKVDAKVQNGVFPSIIETGYHVKTAEILAKRATWQQVAGANLTWKYQYGKIGITATEHILQDTLRPKPTYYNATYFTGKRQAAIGLNYFFHYQRITVFGEVATAQNKRWGWANLTGIRFYPVQEVGLVALYRYFSPTYDNLLGNAFAENTRNNDEQGLYLGAEVKRVPKWRFAFYADAFSFSLPKYAIRYPSAGYDALLQADFYPQEALQMAWKMRAKQKGEKAKYTLRYQLRWAEAGWQLTTTAEGNIAKTDTARATFGVALAQDIAYSFATVPIHLQARMAAFYTPQYDNRVYYYENDVLYAFSIPSLFGVGGRFYLNLRYHINPHVAVYLKAAHTVFASEWAAAQRLDHTRRTDVHLLLRFRW